MTSGPGLSALFDPPVQKGRVQLKPCNEQFVLCLYQNLTGVSLPLWFERGDT